MYKIILRKQTLVLAVAIGLGALYSGQAQAACGWRGIVRSTLLDSSVVISVPPGARAGDPIAPPRESVGGANTHIMDCGPGNSARTARYDDGIATAWPGVMTTRIPGIGIKLSYRDESGLEMPDTAEHVFPFNLSRSYPGPENVAVRYQGRMKVEYFLIDDSFTGGSFPPSGTIARRFGDDTGNSIHSINYNGGSVIRSVCEIELADLTQTVRLGNVNVNVFNGPGSGSPVWEPIRLRSRDCDLSQFNMVQMSARNTNPNVEDPRLFATTGDGRGVGVEVRVAGTNDRIEPGGRVTFPTVAAGGIYNLEARYMRTTAPLVLGPANSTVTIDINYL